VLRLYDTARQEETPFEAGPVVRMYTCGVTPYDSTHLGHASTALVYDILSRRLLDLGHEVRVVRNVTDVDDPLLAKARELGVHYLDLAAAETARYQRDLAALDVLPVASEPRATGAIPDIRGFIGALLEGGHGYAAGGSVYFDVSTFDRWGQVSHYDEATMLALAAERGGNPEDPNKRSPLDFVLWQPSAEGEPAWDSRWGPGRPGWHVECSTLAMRELGPTLDIHGGGTDLIFPHHESEAAQSESVTGKPFVRHWVHAPMVSLDGTKMSKSLGNLVFVSDLLERVEPAVIRLAVIAHHYRHGWEWTDGLLDEAAARLDRWRGAARGAGGLAVLDEVRACLDRDLDTPSALAVIDDAAGSGRDVTAAAALLGVAL
jgi:L-cysteine:1D-myo-inositol 2-amino-2-deoxy-alpha-D-glucopyranoside ligase